MNGRGLKGHDKILELDEHRLETAEVVDLIDAGRDLLYRAGRHYEPLHIGREFDHRIGLRGIGNYPVDSYRSPYLTVYLDDLRRGKLPERHVRLVSGENVLDG